MSNPFAAAITLLKGCLEDCGQNGFGGDQIESMRASLRVLEAAGKVDKEDKELAIHWMEDDYSTIRALLAALPEVKK